jgi:hypothetical protein
MARDRKFVGMLKRQMFKSGGRYFQREERMAKGKEEKIKAKMEMKKQKKDWKLVENSLVLYNRAMEKTGHLPPAKRAKVLETAESLIHRNVMKTWDPRAEKQSFAHQKLSEMTAKLAVERMRLKK